MPHHAHAVVISRPTSLSPEQTEEGVRILHEGLSPNRVMQAIAGFDDIILRTVFRTRLEAAADVNALWIATDSTGKLVGVMVTNLPGSDSGASSSIPKKGTHSWRDGIQKEHREWLDNEFYPSFIAFNNSSFGPNGYHDDVYVNLLAVATSARKQGLGRKLMDEAWTEAEKRGVRGTLITQGDYNVNLYEGMGYRVVQTIDTEVQGETIRTYAMVRVV